MLLLNPEHLKGIYTPKGGTVSVLKVFIKEFPTWGTVYITMEQAKRIYFSIPNI